LDSSFGHKDLYDFGVDAWIVWALIALVLVIVEILTLTLFFAMLAVGAAAAAVAAMVDADRGVQILVFAVVSLAMLLAVRPVARRHLHQAPEHRTNVDLLIGARALVLEQVDGHGGRVRLAGEIWSARSYDGESVLEPGRSVDVIKIEGATALVLG
jgi:membrane protein implicated in regulation of membrane protease activity